MELTVLMKLHEKIVPLRFETQNVYIKKLQPDICLAFTTLSSACTMVPHTAV